MRWATVPKNNNYEISDEGEVRNKNTGRILSGSVNNGGYRTVHINRNESPDFVHRLVAETFIQNPEPENYTAFSVCPFLPQHLACYML